MKHRKCGRSAPHQFGRAADHQLRYLNGATSRVCQNSQCVVVLTSILSTAYDGDGDNKSKHRRYESLQSQLVRMFIQRIFRCLYDKEEPNQSTSETPRQQVTMAIVEAFELYDEESCFPEFVMSRCTNVEQSMLRDEVDLSVEPTGCSGGPIESILTLIRIIYIAHSHAPLRAHRSCLSKVDSPSTKETLLQDQLQLSSCLLRSFSHMTDIHPDFL